jgi:hypothetical protein
MAHQGQPYYHRNEEEDSEVNELYNQVSRVLLFMVGVKNKS